MSLFIYPLMHNIKVTHESRILSQTRSLTVLLVWHAFSGACYSLIRYYFTLKRAIFNFLHSHSSKIRL